jgi:hypothetical protein
VLRKIIQADRILAVMDISNLGKPLAVAARLGKPETIMLLLEYGANIDVASGKSRFGEAGTPLVIALRNKMTENAVALIEAGAKANIGRCSHRQHTPLHLSVWHKWPAIVQMLLQRGADVTALDENGLTPLHTAVESAIDCNLMKIIEMMVNYGSDLEALTHGGRTVLGLVLDSAWHSSRHAIAYLLRSGAQSSNIRYVRPPRIHWAKSEPWYTELAQALRDREASACRVMDVVSVHFLLTNRFSLPSFIASRILDDAEYWMRVSARIRNTELNSMEEPVLTVVVPGKPSISVVQKLLISVASRPSELPATYIEHY